MGRRLAAILAADVVGYSRMMQDDEVGTLAALKSRRTEVLQPLVAKYHRRAGAPNSTHVLSLAADFINPPPSPLDSING